MKKRLPLFSLFIACTMTVSGQPATNLALNGDATGGLENWTGPVQLTEGGPQGAPCFSVTGGKMLMTRDLIEIDPSKTYRLSGTFKSGGTGPSIALVGLRFFNADEKIIDANAVSAVPDSDTILSAEAGTGSTQVKVQDAASWEKVLQTQRLAIAFATDASGEYKDLPNFQTQRVTDLQVGDEGWDVSLEKPLDRSYPKGTLVRAHLFSGHFMYAFTLNNHLADWTNYQGVIKPVVKNGSPGSTFWPGTKYVKIMILANWGQGEGETLLFGNISLEEVEPES